MIEKSIEAREPFVFEERIVRPDGEERVLLSQGRPVIGQDGDVEALVGVCHDVTEREAIERRLGASERRINAIIDQTPSIVTVKDLEGRYLMVNLEATRVSGVTSDELIGRRARTSSRRRWRSCSGPTTSSRRPTASPLRPADARRRRRATHLPHRHLLAPRRERASVGDVHDRHGRQSEPRAAGRAARADLLERADQPGAGRGPDDRLRAADRRRAHRRAGLAASCWSGWWRRGAGVRSSRRGRFSRPRRGSG